MTDLGLLNATFYLRDDELWVCKIYNQVFPLSEYFH